MELRPAQHDVQISAYLSPPMPRSWFLGDDGSKIIQIQQDRFATTWRKKNDADGRTYPRYSTLFQDFLLEWEGFLAFVKDEKLGTISPNQCDLVYDNQFDKTDYTKGFSNLSSMFSQLRDLSAGSFLPELEVFEWKTKYRLPGGRGRLHITAQPAFRLRDMKLIVSLNLTARGEPKGEGTEELTEWFSMAHEWIVRAFFDVTSPKLQEQWGKQ